MNKLVQLDQFTVKGQSFTSKKSMYNHDSGRVQGQKRKQSDATGSLNIQLMTVGMESLWSNPIEVSLNMTTIIII